MSVMLNAPPPDQDRCVPGTVERRRRRSVVPQLAAPPSSDIVPLLDTVPPSVRVNDPPPAKTPELTMTLLWTLGEMLIAVISRLPALTVPEPEDKSRNAGPAPWLTVRAPETTTKPPVLTFTRPIPVLQQVPVMERLRALSVPSTVTSD